MTRSQTQRFLVGKHRLPFFEFRFQFRPVFSGYRRLPISLPIPPKAGNRLTVGKSNPAGPSPPLPRGTRTSIKCRKIRKNLQTMYNLNCRSNAPFSLGCRFDSKTNKRNTFLRVGGHKQGVGVVVWPQTLYSKVFGSRSLKAFFYINSRIKNLTGGP